MKKEALFGLFIIILFISGCVSYPEQDPQYSAPREVNIDGEVDLPSEERADIVLLGCLYDCANTLGGCIQSCEGLPEYEWAVCSTDCYNNNNWCIGHCVGDRRSEISSP